MAPVSLDWHLTVAVRQISYSADIVAGSLDWDESQLQFHVTSEDADRSRNVTITSRFSLPLAIYNVSLTAAAAEYFKVRSRLGVLCDI